MPEARKLSVEKFAAGPPPLRIHHFLAWMTVAAVLISACLWFDRTARNGPPIQSRTIVNSLMLGAIVIAGALTFTGFGIYWRAGIYAFPATPGELLLSIIARASMAMVAAILGVLVSFAISHKSLAIYYPVAIIVLLIYWVHMNLQGVRQYADGTAWRWAFGSLLVAAILACLLQRALPMIAFLICLLWATWVDFYGKTARGWLHWLGVILAIAITCALMGTFDLPDLFR